jgi:hypothetical protein
MQRNDAEQNDYELVYVGQDHERCRCHKLLHPKALWEVKWNRDGIVCVFRGAWIGDRAASGGVGSASDCV